MPQTGMATRPPSAPTVPKQSSSRTSRTSFSTRRSSDSMDDWRMPSVTGSERYSPSIAPSSLSSRRLASNPHRQSYQSHQSHPSGGSIAPPPFPPSSWPHDEVPPASSSPHLQPHAPIPINPMPDSILSRSTFAALEHSAGTLKRLAKHVVTQASSVLALLEQLDSAEDELMVALGELGRWLEGGYGVTGDVWDAEDGIRKVASERRRRDREDLEVMVIHSLEAVKGEVKRQGLAGHGAQAKFESVAKQYYHGTAAYLAPHGSSPSSHDATDQAQASRTAQWDLVRYNHHSTLLYAVPPSSIGCLDLLVGLYGWVGAQISHVPGKRADTHPSVATDDFGRPSPVEGGYETPTSRGRQLAAMETPVRLLSRDDASARSSVDALTRTLAVSLGHLVQVRGDLLIGWAERDRQTTLLEEHARQLSENVPEASRLHLPPSVVESTATKEKPRKMHKMSTSMGGKLRGLFSSSNNSNPLPTLAERAPPVSSASIAPRTTGRKSFDISARSLANTGWGQPSLRSSQQAPRTEKPVQRSRHSLQVPQGQYRSPFHPADGPPQLPSPSIYNERRTHALAETSAKLNGAVSVGGVGGLNGAGDEDEQREQVGRKREGVLWGTGTWEELDKGGARGKWEHFWVVLAHSKVYEYRDGNKGESTATVIDLKFASVREGRGTDRRFVFEIVTPSKGRRLYQASSEAEMKSWIYALCNAIESCINGTSTLRSSDLQGMSEDLDDHALYIRGKKNADKNSDRRIPFPSSFMASTPSRHSLPAVPRELRHARRASLKDRLKNDLMPTPSKSSNPSPTFEQRPSFLSQGGRMPSYAGSNSGSASRPSSAWFDDPDADIEKRVLEMAALGISPSMEEMRRAAKTHPSPPMPSLPAEYTLMPPPQQVPIQKYDMAFLRRIADAGHNARCADCGRRTKSSRWATLSVRDTSMVMFLCIRCCGVHRGLGTHISKPRSVDLDNWAPESIQLAHQWGNERGNAVWERCKPHDVVPTDDDIADYIRAKYVEGRWVSHEDKARYGLVDPGSTRVSVPVVEAFGVAS